jgi:hypothetical protein
MMATNGDRGGTNQRSIMRLRLILTGDQRTDLIGGNLEAREKITQAVDPNQKRCVYYSS